MQALRDRTQALASEPIASTDRLASLESLRKRALELVPEQRKRYLGMPVPLADAERQAWEIHLGLWQAFYFGYALCGGAAVNQQARAAVWHRALDSLGRAIREHVFAYRPVPPALWRELNTSFRSAEDCSLLDVPVADDERPDDERPGATRTCRQAYLAIVLHDAADLYAVTGAQMQIVEGWLTTWPEAVALRTIDGVEAPTSSLAIDLAADCGARPVREVAAADTVRFIDTHQLAPRLRDLAASLRAGTPAPELDPARSLPRPALERLLTHLYIQWCSAGTGRSEASLGAPGRAQAATNLNAIHFQISGRAFRQPGLRYTHEEEHDLATFGHITERTEQRLLTGRSSALEPWEVLNQSASSLLGMRKADQPGRIEHGQLIVLRTSSIDPPILGVVQRLRADGNGTLAIGIRIIRGEARGIAFRRSGDSTQKYERALLVEADPQRNAPANLILAPGRYAAGAAIEMHMNRAETVSIGTIVERGPNFDRVTFVRA